MRTMFAMGFQPAKRAFFLGQTLSQAQRDHYLIAVGRALTEADEIDAWIKAHPEAQLKPPAAPAVPAGQPAPVAPSVPSDITISPYFTKWVNFAPIRPDMQKFKDRLSNADPASWSSLTDDEHTAFGWVSVIDQIFAAFKDDPKNLTAGRWQGDTRLPDAPGTPESKPAEQPITVPLLNTQLPPTIAGIPTKTVLIGGGVVIGGAILLSIL